jgi:hypothetical protein
MIVVVALCVLTANLIIGTRGAMADTGSLPSVPPIQQSRDCAQYSTTWLLGDIGTLYGTKPSPAHSLPAALTYTLLPYPADFARYTLLSILFGDGRVQTRTDIRLLWQVAKATPSLYLVLYYASQWGKRWNLTVLAVDTYRFVATTAYRSSPSAAELQCGVVFSAQGRHYTIRGKAVNGPLQIDLSHALIRGIDTCR